MQEGEQDWVWVSTACFYYAEEAVRVAGVESKRWLESDGTDTQQGMQKSWETKYGLPLSSLQH